MQVKRGELPTREQEGDGVPVERAVLSGANLVPENRRMLSRELLVARKHRVMVGEAKIHL